MKHENTKPRTELRSGTGVTTSAPGKLMVMGEHAVVYDRPCIVTAVDSRIKVNIEKREDDLLVIDAKQLSHKPYKIKLNRLDGKKNNVPKEIAFVRQSVKRFRRRYDLFHGITVSTESDFSHRYGFGSSSAVSVGTIKALYALLNIKNSKRDIFDMAYQVTLDIQGLGSGFDIAAAVYGGTLYFTTGGKKIEKITDKQLPLVVGYTGVKADTPTLVRQVARLKKKQSELVNQIFYTIELIVNRGKEYIQNADWESLGDVMRLNQGALYSLGVSTPKLDDMCSEALLAGAYGAKLSGAGGGDCMIALASEEKRKIVEKGIQKSGGEIIQVTTSAEGVRIK
jgi:mevalonate kinase